MKTRLLPGMDWSLLAAVPVIASLVSIGGCQPKQGVEHDCACICYKEDGNNVYLLNQTVSTTKECGNVNGSACSGDVNGKHVDGQYANCGPNPNVANAFYDAIISATGFIISGRSADDSADNPDAGAK